MPESTLQPVTQPDTKDDSRESAASVASSLHLVLIHNDEVTPYDYVIDTLNSIFMLSDEIAEHVAWTAHTRGTAVVVVRPRPEAEKLVKAAHARAKFNGFPLTFSIEAN